MKTGRKIGHITSAATRRKISLAKIGCKFSDEHRKNLSKSKTGENHHFFGKKFSEEHRRKIGKKNSGSRSHLWRGGITKENAKVRNSFEYKLWREAVFTRDKWTCVWCGRLGGKLNADHIKPFSQYPELRFAIDNGRTLCLDCHKKTSTYLNNKLYQPNTL